MDFDSQKRFQRDSLIFGLIVIIFLVILAKAVDVLIIQSEFLQKEGNKRQIRVLDIPAPRGQIVDRNGNLMALSTPIDDIWVDPKELSFFLDKKQQQAALLKDSINNDLTELEIAKRQLNIDKNVKKYQAMLAELNLSSNVLTPRILAQSKRRFMYVKRGVLPDVSAKIDALGVPGVFIQNKYKRYYPTAEVNSHVIGFTNIDDEGISGIEKTYDSWLKGEAGKKQVIKDRKGRVIEFVRDIKPAKDGNILTMSIDNDIQYFLVKALKDAMELHQAESAQSVILDAKTGEILALASLPSFNPNNRGQLKGSRLRNRVVSDRIEPGSPIKPFVVAKALDLELLTLDEEIDTSPGSIRVQGQLISDTRNYGKINPATIIQKSSNVGVIKIAFKLSALQQWQMMRDVGFGQDLGLYLPGEALGYIRPVSEWNKIDQASASFGYGFNINLMQLARAYTIFTNEGRLLPVTLLKITDTVNEETNSVQPSSIQPLQVIKPKVANKMLEMLIAVTQKGGTAPKAALDGYHVAGKTGTVHKTKAGGYEKSEYLSLFVGIVPATNPKYIMATVVKQPSRGLYFGGLVAAPIFKTVMEDVLRLKNIPPDKIVHQP